MISGLRPWTKKAILSASNISPTLAMVMCAVDCFGKPWAKLESCVDFAHGCELRLLTVPKAFPDKSSDKDMCLQGAKPWSEVVKGSGRLSGTKFGGAPSAKFSGKHARSEAEEGEVTAEGSKKPKKEWDPEMVPRDDKVNKKYQHLTNNAWHERRAARQCFQCGQPFHGKAK